VARNIRGSPRNESGSAVDGGALAGAGAPVGQLPPPPLPPGEGPASPVPPDVQLLRDARPLPPPGPAAPRPQRDPGAPPFSPPMNDGGSGTLPGLPGAEGGGTPGPAGVAGLRRRAPGLAGAGPSQFSVAPAPGPRGQPGTAMPSSGVGQLGSVSQAATAGASAPAQPQWQRVLALLNGMRF
jgi:hypothetical protein